MGIDIEVQCPVCGFMADYLGRCETKATIKTKRENILPEWADV